MKLQFQLRNDIVFFDKPHGVASLSPGTGKLGSIEILSKEVGQQLYVVHNLETAATGTCCFAKSAERAKQLSNQLKIKYLFVTDCQSTQSEFTAGRNAETTFKRVKRSPFYELWEAQTRVSESSQIRRQAGQVGLGILGDIENGGSAFPQLCLHAAELFLESENQLFTSAPPRFFERLGLLKDRDLVQIIAEIDCRQRSYNFLSNPAQALRLYHPELPTRSSFQKIKWDLLGPVLWGSWYENEEPSAIDFRRFDFIASLLGRALRVRKMLNRGQDPLSKIDWTLEELGQHPPQKWTATEHEVRYQFYAARGLSPGLFLDQRNNRHYVLNNSKNKSVLNLFSYTCGFSLCAALGGSKEVVSVDVSRDFLDWGKENFVLNQLNPEQTDDSGKARYEFFKQDSFLFLKACSKRNRRFDLIICDPPSFSRSKEGVFSLEKDFTELLELCSACLNQDGLLLFSCNYEGWDLEELRKQALRVRSLRPDPLVEKSISLSLDFEKPNQPRLLKSLYLRKLKN